jgi:hypothetical protein
MLNRFLFTCIILTVLWYEGKSQPIEAVSVNFIKKESSVLPGQIVNLAFFIKNNTNSPKQIQEAISVPNGWNVISETQSVSLKPSEQKFSIITLQIPSNYPVGTYNTFIYVIDTVPGDTIAFQKSEITVNEVENISMQLVEMPGHISAGEKFKATYLIQNLGNTTKKIFIETNNCDVEGGSEIKIEPGESSRISIYKQTSEDIIEIKKEYFNVRTLVSDHVIKSIYRFVLVFPSKNTKKDLFFRFPVSASINYLSTNRSNNYDQAYQYQIFGSGSLDPEGKHQLEFLARGPNNTNLSFLGQYNQYYLSYANKNLELFVGEKAFTFTPLTESSRYGIGTENKFILNNGLSFGFLYVKPRFYENIHSEIAAYTNFEFSKKNEIGLYYVLKRNSDINDLTYLTSLTTTLNPFERTTIELEISRGLYQGIWDNALRTNLSTSFSIFQFAGNYFYTGKNYPGYFSNSKFYSGNFSIRLTPKLSIGLYAKEDFLNAQLDTFFITAPYSKSIRSIINYNIAPRTYLKLYWREFERKDRLVHDKFHYKTKSINTQFSQKFRKINYFILGEYGKTTNLLLESGQNQQNTYRGSVNFAYNFNSLHAFKFFGSWSNINSFVSGEQRNLTAGLSLSSQISKNLKANFHIQNAYDIDDYYRNRNLMQLHLDYKFLKKHSLSLRGFYTIFTQQVDDPEFTLSATYTYKFGLPLKQIIKAGHIKGRITNNNGEPVEGIILHLINKTTISDKNGEFWFKSIQPGKHLLTIDRSKLEINETTNIPTPIEIDVIEDNESFINLKITTGAKVFGKFIFEKNKISVLNDLSVKPKNIIVELKNDFEQFRITTDDEGNFSFPLVRPGEWIFKMYSNSIPGGYEVAQTVYNLNLKPGEDRSLQVKLTSKKRNIIFKSQNISLSNSGFTVAKPIKLKTGQKIKKNQTKDSLYYSVQIGAFRRKLKNNSRFFKGEQFVFEKQINNLHKYYIGNFSTYNEASKEKDRLNSRFKKAFVVVIINDKVLSLKDAKINNKE